MAESNNSAARLAKYAGSDTKARQERTDKLVMTWQDVGPHLHERRLALNQKLPNIDATAPPPVVGGPGASQPPAPTAFEQPDIHTRATRLAGNVPVPANAPTKLSLPSPPQAAAPIAPQAQPQATQQQNFKDLLDAIKDLTAELKNQHQRQPSIQKKASGEKESKSVTSGLVADIGQKVKSAVGPMEGSIISAAMKFMEFAV